jgi:ribosomal protein S18 acetylase RimI-like enzyme
VTDLPVLAAVEACYDAIPRVGGARVEAVGPFELFLRNGVGWPLYARPRLGTTSVTVDDVARVLARQAELGVPRAIEWVHDLVPGLLPAVEATGLPVQRAPLMVLANLTDDSDVPIDVEITLLDPDAEDFADSWAVSSAVAAIGFGSGGTAVGATGPAERDAVRAPSSPEMLAFVRAGLRRPDRAEAIATSRTEGVLARGALQGAGSAAEIVGVATLPSARRRGLGRAVSAFLARHARASGHDLVFLSAASEDVARVYERAGFRRVGTACIAEPTDH